MVEKDPTQPDSFLTTLQNEIYKRYIYAFNFAIRKWALDPQPTPRKEIDVFLKNNLPNDQNNNFALLLDYLTLIQQKDRFVADPKIHSLLFQEAQKQNLTIQDLEKKLLHTWLEILITSHDLTFFDANFGEIMTRISIKRLSFNTETMRKALAVLEQMEVVSSLSFLIFDRSLPLDPRKLLWLVAIRRDLMRSISGISDHLKKISELQ